MCVRSLVHPIPKREKIPCDVYDSENTAFENKQAQNNTTKLCMDAVLISDACFSTLELRFSEILLFHFVSVCVRACTDV